MTKIKLGNR